MLPISFAEFTAEVLSLYQSPARRKSTRSKVEQVLRELAETCPTTADLGPAAIGDWLAAHPARAAMTHRSLLSALRAACAYGAYRGYLANPFAFRALSRWLPSDELGEPEPFRRHRSAAEVAAILARADLEAVDWKGRRLRALVHTYAFTGAGKAEILGLRVADVDLENRTLSIRSHARRRLKTGARAARLPICLPLLVVLEDWIGELLGCEWLFPNAGRSAPWLHGGPGHRPLDRVKALASRAGVEGFTILSLRHTVATLSDGWGWGPNMLQRILRHSTAATQKHYRHEDLDQLRKAAGRITYDPEEPS